MKRRQRKGLVHVLVRQVADQDADQVPGLLKLFFERRKQLLRLRQGRFLSRHIETCGRTVFELPPHDFEGAGIGADDTFDGGDLVPYRRLLDRGGDQVGCKRDIGCLELEPLGVRLCLERFHRAPVAAEDVWHEADRQLCAVPVINNGRAAWGRGVSLPGRDDSAIALEAWRVAPCIPGYLDARWRIACLNRWEEQSLLRVHVLLGLAQRSLSGLDSGVGLERLPDQGVELRRPEQGPPFGRDIARRVEGLGCPGDSRRRGSRHG